MNNKSVHVKWPGKKVLFVGGFRQLYGTGGKPTTTKNFLPVPSTKTLRKRESV
jgi:hypothetical protein